jgi:3-oxoacyl-ACP reductase-like protein
LDKGNTPFTIQIQTYSMGKDRVFLITGGQAHIGAAAMAYSIESQVKVDSLTVPEHREETLARDLANWAYAEIGQTVCVLIGIHFDYVTKCDIDRIIEVVYHEMKQELARIQG